MSEPNTPSADTTPSRPYIISFAGMTAFRLKGIITQLLYQHLGQEQPPELRSDKEKGTVEFDMCHYREGTRERLRTALSDMRAKSQSKMVIETSDPAGPVLDFSSPPAVVGDNNETLADVTITELPKSPEAPPPSI